MADSSNLVFRKKVDNPSLGGSGATGTWTAGLHALFDAVTPAQATAGSVEYRMVGISNTHPTDTIEDLKVYLSSASTSADTDIEFGVPGVTVLNSTDVWPTALADESTAPAGVTFYAAGSLATAVEIGDVPPLRTRILYLKRVVTAGADALTTDTCTVTVTNRVP
jgi:hypothetical protein